MSSSVRSRINRLERDRRFDARGGGDREQEPEMVAGFEGLPRRGPGGRGILSNDGSEIVGSLRSNANAPDLPRNAKQLRETTRRQQSIKQEERQRFLRDRGLTETFVKGKRRDVVAKKSKFSLAREEIGKEMPSRRGARREVKDTKSSRFDSSGVAINTARDSTGRRPNTVVGTIGGGSKVVGTGGLVQSLPEDSTAIPSSAVAGKPESIKIGRYTEVLPRRRPPPLPGTMRPPPLPGIVRGPKPIKNTHSGVVRHSVPDSTAPSVLGRGYKMSEASLKNDPMDDVKRTLANKPSVSEEYNHYKFGSQHKESVGDRIAREAGVGIATMGRSALTGKSFTDSPSQFSELGSSVGSFGGSPEFQALIASSSSEEDFGSAEEGTE